MAKTTEYVIKDFYGDKCLGDAAQNGARDKAVKPEGYVEIYEVDETGERKLVGKNNLVLYNGREWIAQKLVQLDNPNVSESTYNMWINWFGLGDGGVLPADPIDPIPPVLTDTELYSLIMINASDASSADYHVIDANHPEEGYYKHPFDSVEFEQDALNDDKWLVLRITVNIGVDDANGKQLSEAGLYTAASDAGGYSGDFALFARVTFPSIIKTSDRRLIFRWYLYI